MEKLLEVDVASITTDEFQFVARVCYYTWNFLQNPENEILKPYCRNFWKKFVLQKKPYQKQIIFTPPGGIKSEHMNSRFKVVLSDKLAKMVSKFEEEAKEPQDRWNKASQDSLIQASKNHIQRKQALKSFQNNIRDKILEIQQTIFKPVFESIKKISENETLIRRSWKRLIKSVSHERAIWPLDPSLLRWELDPIEGPMRMRLRLRPLQAIKHPIIRELIKGFPSEKDYTQAAKDPRDIYIPIINRPKLDKYYNLYTLFDADSENSYFGPRTARSPELLPGETFIMTINCSNITPFHRREGNLLISEFRIYFFDEHEFQDTEEERRKITSVHQDFFCDHDEISDLQKRRYLLKSTALELFLSNGKTYFLSFRTEEDRNNVYDQVIRMDLPNFNRNGGSMSLTLLTQQWQKGLITNFEYLMALNTLSERTFNDLTQYPVFPFIIADYKSEELDLTNPNTFRDLTKPMGAQDPQRLKKFEEKYDTLLSIGQPCLYGSHYSNMGSVLHFLIRLEPFSRYLIEFQGGKFDVADRVFYSIQQSWDLCSKVSSSDVKELIPEFFYLQNFLNNVNQFDLGTKQNNKKVEHVNLPRWSKGDYRTFIQLHIEALESDHVSQYLHTWLDLIWGYKQRGEEALAAKNLFHPLTYEGSVNIDDIADPIEKAATISQITNFGQTPKQLFNRPHPKKGPRDPSSSRITVASHFDRITSLAFNLFLFYTCIRLF